MRSALGAFLVGALMISEYPAGGRDTLGSPSGWTVAASDGVEAAPEPASPAAVFRVRFDFHGEAGYFSARKNVSLALPENYVISFSLVGQTRENDLQLKLIDESGDNVWWFRALATAASPRERRFVFRKRDLSFAWGPAGGGEIRRPAAIEFALAAGEGGNGWLEIRDLALTPLPPDGKAESRSPTSGELFESLARHGQRGDYPRSISGEQSYWTVVGVDGGPDTALLGEDGAVEAGRGNFSVEPFLQDGPTLLDWSRVAAGQSLEEGDLPIPTVTWTHDGLSLRITAFAERASNGIRAVVRYRLRNAGSSQRRVRLFLAVRPFQVNPPRQFLGRPGGFTAIRAIDLDPEAVRVDGRAAIFPSRPPDDFAVGNADDGRPTAWFSEAHRLRHAENARGFASAVLAYDFEIPPAGEAETDWVLPLAGAADPGTGRPDDRQRAVAGQWRESLGRVDIRLPKAAADLPTILRSSLAHILLDREGAALQPGPRAYRRSWIRDGSIMAEALLRLGHPHEVGEYLDWYAEKIYPTGKVPCCVDHRGRDPVAENDSSGEFLFLAGEYVRYTGDEAWLARHWTVIERVVDYLDALREPPVSAGSTPLTEASCGLLRASISHEGYSSKPVHSFWDDFLARRGLEEAVAMAAAAGHRGAARRFAALSEEFRGDLRRAIDAAISLHGIDFIPGSVELGDFDPTSTAIAISIARAEADLPRPELDRTFDRYLEDFRARRTGRAPWDAYTPYEFRVADAFVRLGRPERAHELLAFFRDGRRPPGWNQWPEVVRRDPRAPAFLGDLPHAWVGAEFLLAALDMLAFARESDAAIVLGAGIPESWARDPGGVSVRGLRTPWGSLDYVLRAVDDRSLRITIGGSLRLPPGGIAVRWPLPERPRTATVNGREAPIRRGRMLGRELPAEVIVRELPADVAVRR